MNHIYLTLQADYENISLGIWNGTQPIATTTVHKTHACQQLMSSMLNLLNEQSLTFKDLNFIAVNQGPAPFTTLRIVITTANALSFAHNIPLVGVDALRTFAQEYAAEDRITVILLNAFSQDAYFAIRHNGTIETGCKPNATFLEELARRFSTESITFVGNGTDLFKEKIIQCFNKRAHFLEHNPSYTNFTATALTGYQQWIDQINVHQTLLPLYLKIQTYKIST
jgi:tRNA threonylcarbamoyl adenosine modification protein YeaZ